MNRFGCLIICNLLALFLLSPAFAQYRAGAADVDRSHRDYARRSGTRTARRLSTGWRQGRGSRTRHIRDYYRHTRGGRLIHVHGYYRR